MKSDTKFGMKSGNKAGPTNQQTGDTAAALRKTASEMQTLAHEILEHGIKKGADRIKVGTSGSITRRLVVENKEVSLANSLEDQKFSLLVHKDQKKGSATTNIVRAESIRKGVEDALALASFSVADPALNMPDSSVAPKAIALDFMFDERTADTTLAEIQELMGQALARATKDKRVAIDKFEMSVSTSFHALYNSLGVAQSELQTMIGWSFFGMGVDGDAVSGFDYDSGFAWKTGDTAARLMETAESFAAKVTANLHPRKANSYKGLVVFSPRAVEELLTGFMLYHASGSAVMDGKSRWQNEVGKAVVSPVITLRDQPHNPAFAGVTTFDGDGMPTRDHVLFDSGKLCMHLHDCYSAKRCKTTSNHMSGGPFGMSLAPGGSLLADLLRSRREILLVDRFSGNTDAIKGDFSGVAKSSRLYVDGKDSGAVTETMIAGNFFEFAKKIEAASLETEAVGGSFTSPWLLVDGISVTGG
jgi:PmbA protein